MLVAALLTIPAIVLEELALPDVGRAVALGLNWTIWLAFAAELVTMLVIVEDRARWLRTHPLEVAIVLLTGPFLPSVFGVLRTLRLLPLVRVALSARRLLSLEGIRLVGLITLSLIMVAGFAFSRLETGPGGEELTAWNGVWWAVTTVTTVGYGDLSPQSGSGQVLAISVMVLGIGFVAMLTAAAAEFFVRTGLATSDEDDDDREYLRRRIDEFGERLARIEAAVGADRPGRPPDARRDGPRTEG